MSSRFCAICGTKQGPFVKNLCEECYKKEYPLKINIPDKVEIEICPSCRAIKHKGVTIPTWDEEEIGGIIGDLARSIVSEKLRVRFPYTLKFDDNIEERKIMNKGVKFFELKTIIQARPYEEFGEVKEEHITKIYTMKVPCNECTKLKGGYFEAIIQIRAENRKPTDDEINTADQIITQVLNDHANSKLMYILDYKIDKNGITGKVSSKLLAEEMAKKIRDSLAATYSVAYELKTVSSEGQKVYTNTYLVKLSKLTKEDIVEFEGTMWKVLDIHKSLIKSENLENHEIKYLHRRTMEEQSEKRNEQIIEREYMVLAKENDIAMMMTMDNYENYEDKWEKLPQGTEVGKTVKGFLFEEKNYYVEEKK